MMKENNRESAQVTCPFCGSDNVKKGGTARNGVRRYACLNEDCSHKSFLERYTRKAREQPMSGGKPVTCPFCGSDNVRKASSFKGVRRFFCLNKDCPHKSFSERYTNKACDPREPSPATCPHCGSDRVRFNTTTKYGVRHYLCLNKDCSHKSFSERYTRKGCDPVHIRENEQVSAGVTCPFCGSANVKADKTGKNGVRRFRCLNEDCSHKTFSEQYKARWNVTCPRCGSGRVSKNGRAEDGRQYYLCLNKDCPHKSFVETYKNKARDPSYVRENERAFAGITCPHCGSANVKVDKIDKNGVWRFRCLNEDCSHKTFGEQYKTRGNVKCPHCGSGRVCKHGRTGDGRQQYLCLNKDCPHKSFVETYKNKARDPSYVRENEFAGVTCPHCGSGRVRKHGRTEDGRQYYLCLNKDCPHKSFVEERPDKASPQSRHNLRQVASPAMTGLPVPQQTGDPLALTERLALCELIMEN